MIRSRKFYISLVGTLAWSSTAADTVLTILEASSFPTTEHALKSISVAAGALDSLSLCCIALYAVQKARNDVSKKLSVQVRAMDGLAIVTSGTALIINLVLIIMIKSQKPEIVRLLVKGPISDWDPIVAGQIAVWVVSCLGQLLLFTVSLWYPTPPKAHSITVSGPRDSVMSESRTSPPSKGLYIMEPTMPDSTLAAALPSPTFSSRSSHSLKSFRESLRHVVRPTTSRTTLISKSSFTRDARSIYSQTESVDNVSHSDGFDTWDTSSVSLQARDAVLQSAPSKGTVLEPIPGSRPVTPARALENFVLEELAEEEELTPPPKLMPDISRPPSPAVSEAGIHPLFRSDSPVPPPEATPGTNILASPMSNQAIACPTRSFNRMRSNSLLSQTQRATRSRTASPQTTSRTSRTPSPPSRELTPPIPDFVLHSSPRSSMSGSRRVQLQY